MTVELEAGPAGRFWSLLEDAQRETLRARQLQVIAKLPPSSPADTERELADNVNPILDTWLYFADEEDVRMWLVLLAPWLPDLVVRLSGCEALRTEFAPLPAQLLTTP